MNKFEKDHLIKFVTRCLDAIRFELHEMEDEPPRHYHTVVNNRQYELVIRKETYTGPRGRSHKLFIKLVLPLSLYGTEAVASRVIDVEELINPTRVAEKLVDAFDMHMGSLYNMERQAVDSTDQKEMVFGAVRDAKTYAFLRDFRDRYKINEHENIFAYKKVIFNDPATIVIWEDGTKTVVKAMEGTPYDPAAGLAFCFMERALGSKNAMHKVLDKEVSTEEMIKEQINQLEAKLRSVQNSIAVTNAQKEIYELLFKGEDN